jgi:hypothetical protein
MLGTCSDTALDLYFGSSIFLPSFMQIVKSIFYDLIPLNISGGPHTARNIHVAEIAAPHFRIDHPSSVIW